MILQIRKFKDPVLRKKAKEVKEVDESVKELVENMQETMKKERGAGLAAPQIGEDKRIITIDSAFGGTIFVLINPKITKRSGDKIIEEEGCLSFPNIFLKIKRPEKIELESMDKEGKKVRIKAEGLLARVLQHEIDHLDGILFFDRLPLVERIKFKFKNKLY